MLPLALALESLKAVHAAEMVLVGECTCHLDSQLGLALKYVQRLNDTDRSRPAAVADPVASL